MGSWYHSSKSGQYDLDFEWGGVTDRELGRQLRTESETRRVTDEELEGWDEAAATRSSSVTQRRIVASLRRTNYFRYRRLCKDFAWMQKQLKKMGLNPEDARLYVGDFEGR